MEFYHVNYSRGQMKIQEMAFVLVALMIFFAMVALVYFSIKLAGLKEDALSLREEQAKELVLKLAGTPEFSWTAFDCGNCIDMDKAFLLKNRKTYKDFWSLDYLRIETVYPPKNGECTESNYPDCNSITIVNKTSQYGSPSLAFVALCRQEFLGQSDYVRCEVGRIYASGKNLNG